jgi:hypothetical protein
MNQNAVKCGDVGKRVCAHSDDEAIAGDFEDSHGAESLSPLLVRSSSMAIKNLHVPDISG